MASHWEGRVSGKLRSAWKVAFTVTRTAGGTGNSEAPSPITDAQEAAAKAATDLLLDALGITATDTNFQVAAQGFDNAKPGPLHEALISITVQKRLV